MQIERGCFERPAWHLVEAARARVIVESGDFERLELREFERGGRLSPCLAWCHKTIGPGYVRWEMEAAKKTDVFYFTRPNEAAAFYAMFAQAGASRSSELRLAA
jgi:hypothetical protein